MPLTVCVLAPVLGRPQRVGPLIESLAASQRPGHRLFNLALLYLVSPDDETTQEQACRDFEDTDIGGIAVHVDVMEFECGAGDYARKINHGWRRCQNLDVDFVFTGADDLVFHRGWVEQAVAAHLDTGACVVGTNDMGSPGTENGWGSTHTLVHRGYTCGLIDNPDPGLLLFEGYDHSFVDNELVGTALHRGLYTHAFHAHVEHLHPIHRKAKTDATYEKAERAFVNDRELHRFRRQLWETPAA